MARRKRRSKSPHPGVRLKKRIDRNGTTIWLARFVDPDTGRERDKSLRPLGLTSHETRRAWCIRKSKALLKRKADLAAGDVPAKATQTFIADAIDDYLEHVDATLRPKTAEVYREDVARFEAWAQRRGIRYVEELRPRDLAAFGESLARSRRQAPAKHGRRGERKASREPLSIPTKNRRVRSNRTMFLRWRRLGLMPLVSRDEIAEAMKLRREPRPSPTALTPPQLASLLAAALRHDAETFVETRPEHRGEGPRGTTARHEAIAPFVAIVMLTGCRVGEVLSLRWDQVDLAALDTNGKKVGAIRLGTETKTHRGRVIDLAVAPAALKILSALKIKAGSNRYVFGGNAPLSRGRVEAARKRLRKVYGAPEFTWQMLRQTAGSYLTCAPSIFGAASAFLSARQLGHSAAVAERHYVGTVRGIPREARTLEVAMGIEDELAEIVAIASARKSGAAYKADEVTRRLA